MHWIPALCLVGSLHGTAACVPRERPEGEQAPAPRKVPRTTAVASREEVPESPAHQADASPASGRVAPSGSAIARAAPGLKPPLAASAPASARPAPSGASAAVTVQPGGDPLLTKPFSDDFARSELGSVWHSTSKQWKIENGRVCVQNARNHPLWLKQRLPTNASIEFTATSYNDDGDIKVEMWGDGKSAASGASYNDATGYIAIFGGWKNSFHVLARLDEHAKNRPEIKLSPDSEDPRAFQVEKGVEYAIKIERADGKTLRWLVDDIELFAFQDKSPLIGPGHDHFGFNNWQVRVCFDNLKVVPLP